MRISHWGSVTVWPHSKSCLGSWFPIKWGKLARPGFLQGSLNAFVALKVLLSWTAPGRWMCRTTSAAPPQRGLGQRRLLAPCRGERGRCLDTASPGDLRGQRSQQLMLRSQPVPLLGRDSPHGKPVAPSDGRSGGPPGTGPAWPASHPMFCSQSLECPGTQSSAPWGRQWCHRLDLIAGQVPPPFQLGTRQAPSGSCCQSQPVCVCPSAGSGDLQLGAGGLPRGGSSSLRGPWARLRRVATPPSQLPPVTDSFACDPRTPGPRGLLG